MLHEMLARLAKEYTYQRAKPFSNSEFGNFVRHDLAIEARKNVIFLPYELTIKASVGAGVWAAVPWLAFFDPLITDSATSGFYVVYLINSQSEEIILSLNQGTTAVYQEFGETKGQAVLNRRAVDIRERIATYARKFSLEPIDLGSEASLPKGYVAGHAFGRTYSAKKIQTDIFYKDLELILAAYAALVDRGGTMPTDSMMEEAGTTDIEETRRYILSRRIERSKKVRRLVLERRGAICESCFFDPIKHTGFSGPIINAPLDVHHGKPIHHLAEGESRRYKIPEDFLVLCPTCHRMIHKLHNVADLELLRSKIRFVHAEKLPNLF